MPHYNPNGIWTSKQPQHERQDSDSRASETAKTETPMGGEVTPPVPKGTSHGGLIAVIAAVVILLAAGAALYYMMRPMPAPAIALAFTKPDHVFLGDPFPFAVSISNESPVILSGVTLVLALPSSTALASGDVTSSLIAWNLGDLAPGATVTQSSTLIALSDPQNVATIGVRVGYGASSSKMRFETSGSAAVSVGEPSMSVSIAAPQNAVGGSDIVVALSYANRTSHDLPGVEVRVEYPPAFIFGTSTPPAGANAATWEVGDLAPNASGTIVLRGKLAGVPGTAYSFRSFVGTAFEGRTFLFAGPSADVTLAAQPLSIAISTNNAPDYISGTGDSLTYAIDYANHASVAMQGVTIKTKLTGAMFDPSSVATNGSFNSLADTVTWTSSAVPGLASIAPGATGQVSFRVKTLRSFPLRRPSDKNYSLQVDGTIISPTVLPGVAATSTAGAASIATKVGGTVSIAAKGYHYDNTSGILNTGPYPPVANQETRYTVRWILGDTGTDLKDATVSATLPAGISFTGNVSSNASATPQFDVRTGMVSWSMPFVPAGAGTVAKAPEAVFQIAVTPGINQVGTNLDLLPDTTVNATDAFTGQTLSASASQIKGDLPDDPTARQARDPRVQAP